MSGYLGPFEAGKTAICCRAFHLVRQAESRVEWAMMASRWLEAAQKWAVRHGDDDLALWLGRQILSCLSHKWASWEDKNV